MNEWGANCLVETK